MLSSRIHPNIIPQHFGAVCCVICWLPQWIISPPLPSPPHSCIILLRISQFDRFSTFLLKSDNTQWYPMHMKHNRAPKHSSGWLMGYIQYPTLYTVNCCGGDNKAAATQPQSCPRQPCCHRTFPWVRWWDWLRRALRQLLWMAAVHDELGGQTFAIVALFSACVCVCQK
jgi:hypothetical protein